MRARLLGLTAIAWLAAGAAQLFGQSVAFRVSAVDMYGGAAFPSEAQPGVVFGARIGLLDLFAGSLQAGFELDWWAAERQDVELEIRDSVAGIALWDELGGAALRPYLGVGAALHSVHTSPIGADGPTNGGSPAAERISGFKAGASGFGGLTLRLSRTEAIWLIVEYRYSLVSEVSYHAVRLGARLRTSRR